VFLFLEHASTVNVAFQSIFSFENISKQCFCIFLFFKIYFLQEINIVDAERERPFRTTNPTAS